MKKFFITFLTLAVCFSSLFSQEYSWSTFNLKAGQEIQCPVDCGYLFSGKTNFTFQDWDYSVPKEFGKKVFVATLPYTYYFKGEKVEIYYEIVIKNISVNKDISSQEIFSEIKKGTVIGKASADNPAIMIRTVTGYDPNLVLDSQNPPKESGNYMYFDASTLMPTCPKFLTFKPVTSKKDEIEFWDYPESLEDLTANCRKGSDGRDVISRFPFFQIMIKTQFDSYPEEILKNNMNDIILQRQFYSNCDTEKVINFDGLKIHLVFQVGFNNYLKEEYTLGDDIYLYLMALCGKNGEIYFYVRDYTLNSPEERYNNRLDIISEASEFAETKPAK